ncbi:hypothetical protein Shyhy01_76340 [Streptomyces hygroscopicus subsp. hygroscopicus]|nr:hypothetical protein Shyhy01_76340 [Streptomyces hygroscopicus subsp. hygroscopicus]
MGVLGRDGLGSSPRYVGPGGVSAGRAREGPDRTGRKGQAPGTGVRGPASADADLAETR